MDNMYRKKYYVRGQHSINIVECKSALEFSRVQWSALE
jgi:hypothetical protein